MRTVYCLLTLAALLGCRTAKDDSLDKNSLTDLTPSKTSSNGKTLILKKVTGAITRSHAENRYEECLIYKEDLANSAAVAEDLDTLKTQTLQEAFIFRPQIPSHQFYGYIADKQFLLSEIGDEKARYLMPEKSENPGNPVIDRLMKIFEEYCKNGH